MINKELLNILACPKCKGDIELIEERGLLCRSCKLLYLVKDGIPVMLIDQALSYDDNEGEITNG